MRGKDEQQLDVFSYVSPEQRVPQDHPLRPLRVMTDEALRDLQSRLNKLYAKTGQPSIAPEKLLRALLLQALYSVRSERLLMEQLDYNLLFRWFVGLNMDDAIWDVTVFTKNRERLLDGNIAEAFFQAVLQQARELLMGKNTLLKQSNSWLRVIGRLRPGAKVDGLAARFTTITRQWLVDDLGAQYPQYLSQIQNVLPKQNINVVPGGAGVPEMKDGYKDSLRSRAGVPLRATPKMACSRSTTALRNGRCGPSHSDGRTSCSLDQIAEASGPRPCTRSSGRPSSTASIRNSISAPCWHELQITPSAGSRNFYPGTWPHNFRTTLPRLLRHTHQVSTKNKRTPVRHSHPVKRGSSNACLLVSLSGNSPTPNSVPASSPPIA
jgi:transposase